MAEQIICIYNWSGVDLNYFRLSPTQNVDDKIVEDFSAIPSGGRKEYAMFSNTPLTFGYFAVSFSDPSILQPNDCMTMSSYSTIIICNSDAIFYGSNCFGSRSSGEGKLNFISGDEYWPTDQSIYDSFPSDVYLLGVPSNTVDISLLTQGEKPIGNFTVHNYSSFEISNTQLYTTTSTQIKLIDSSEKIQSGGSATFLFPSFVKQGVYNIFLDGGDMNDCMLLSSDSHLIVTDILRNEAFTSSNCPGTPAVKYPGMPLLFVDGNKVWEMNESEFNTYISKKTPSTYLLGMPADNNDLPRTTVPPAIVADPPKPDVDDKTSYTWLWILLIVLVLVIFAVLAAYIIKKSSKKL